MKKKNMLIVLFLIIVVIGVTLFLFWHKSNKGNIDVPKSPIEKIEEINNQILSGMTNEQYKKLTGKIPIPISVLIGQDSYLRERINKNLRKSEKIEEYEKRADEYASNVENVIKDNFTFEIIDSVVSAEGDTVVKIQFKPYYYAFYIKSLDELTPRLMELAGYDNAATGTRASNKRVLDYYKAKVKAIEILNANLDDYVNSYEYFETQIIFKNGNIDSGRAYIESYLLTVDGSMSKSNDFKDDKKTNELVKKYIKESIETGVLNTQDPLKLS